MQHNQRNVLLVGGNTGMGRATVDLLDQGGANLTVAVRSGEGLPVSSQTFDASDPDQTLELPDALDALVYFPGTIQLKPFHQLTREDFDRDMEVNFFGAVRVIQQALPALKKAPGGNASITLFSTVAVGLGMPFHASIASAKAAVEGLVRSLAAEFSPKIRVNAIAPSLTDTPLAGQFLSSDERREAAAKRHPLERIGQPEEIAELISFLIGDGARSITGQVIRVDGGLSSVRKF